MTQYLTSLICGAKTWDPMVVASAAMLMTGVAVAASLVPARRASRVHPIEALRHT
jgi:putative ABC transport system permease protein